MPVHNGPGFSSGAWLLLLCSSFPGVNADYQYYEEELDAGERGGEIRRLSETQPLVPIRISRPKNSQHTRRSYGAG